MRFKLETYIMHHVLTTNNPAKKQNNGTNTDEHTVGKADQNLMHGRSIKNNSTTFYSNVQMHVQRYETKKTWVFFAQLRHWRKNNSEHVDAK